MNLHQITPPDKTTPGTRVRLLDSFGYWGDAAGLTGTVTDKPYPYPHIASFMAHPMVHIALDDHSTSYRTEVWAELFEFNPL